MSRKPWSGRFDKPTDKAVEEFTASIHFDARLIEHDIRGSIAHARMLGKQGILTTEDTQEIIRGLEAILEDWRRGKIELDPSAEDVHMNVEKLLAERIGEAAGKLHTARSRNDQVAVDIRMYLKEEIDAISDAACDLQRVLLDLARKHKTDVMPGCTHMQHAQPLLLAHHLLAYFWMLARDRERLEDCRKRVDIMPLGSGALAGTTFPLDREFVAKELGFSRISQNSVDAVSDRDFAAEFLAACSIIMVHLSRLSEEIVLWNCPEFGFVELDDAFTTGSSIMPKKKNPDVAELVRAKTGRVFGDLMAMLTLQKGLPLSYNRDLQEDKEPIFDAADTVKASLSIYAGMLRTAKFNTARMAAAARGDFSTATDLADHLARKGIPFRKAHEMVGKLVARCIREGKVLEDLTAADIRAEIPDADDEALAFLQPEASASARDVPGGTGTKAVEAQIAAAENLLAPAAARRAKRDENCRIPTRSRDDAGEAVFQRDDLMTQVVHEIQVESRMI